MKIIRPPLRSRWRLIAAQADIIATTGTAGVEKQSGGVGGPIAKPQQWWPGIDRGNPLTRGLLAAYPMVEFLSLSGALLGVLVTQVVSLAVMANGLKSKLEQD